MSMLASLMQKELIQLNVPAEDWQDAVRKSARPLVDKEYILQEYIDAMIESVKEAGPYIVIAKHIAMPHAKAESGVLREGISITTLETPVCFGNEDNDPVKYVFCLSSLNSSNHLDLMQGLTDVMEDEEFFKLLDRTTSPEDVLNYLIESEK